MDLFHFKNCFFLILQGWALGMDGRGAAMGPRYGWALMGLREGWALGRDGPP